MSYNHHVMDGMLFDRIDSKRTKKPTGGSRSFHVKEGVSKNSCGLKFKIKVIN